MGKEIKLGDDCPACGAKNIMVEGSLWDDELVMCDKCWKTFWTNGEPYVDPTLMCNGEGCYDCENAGCCPFS